MRVLITGGAGFIGSHLAEALLADGHQVVVVDDLSTGRSDFVPSSASLVQMDIRDPSFPEVVQREKPEIIYHLAAQISVAASTRDPRSDAAANIDGTLAALAAAERAGVQKLVNVSTATVYAHDAELPWNEQSRKGPTAAYAIAKLACEHYVHHYALFHQLATVTFRLGNVYGPRQNAEGEAGVIAIFLNRMLRRQQVEIHGDGEQSKDFVYVGDVVRALASAAATALPECRTYNERAINLGAGQAHSVNEVFSRLKELTDYRVEAVHTASRPADQPRMILDCGRARELLGWRPEVGWKEGLARTCEWFREELSGVGST